MLRQLAAARRMPLAGMPTVLQAVVGLLLTKTPQSPSWQLQLPPAVLLLLTLRP